MKIEDVINELSENLLVFEGLLKEVSDELQTWKAKPDKWNLLIVVCHLLDEEVEDWRARVELILSNPEEDFVKINPQEWVQERNYESQDYGLKLETFISERKNSILWLRSLQNPEWKQFKEHPHFGKMTARLFLENWLMHDLLHIRQIIRIKNEFIRTHSDTSFEYAGDW